MCGYIGNLHECPAVLELMLALDLPPVLPLSRGYQRRMYDGLVVSKNSAATLSQAIWWFALKEQDGGLIVNQKLTSFNARDLSKPLWRAASQSARALVFCTELGESQGKDRYLMRSDEGFALGCLYKDWIASTGDTLRSFAVITRPPHPRFSRYHEKSIPLFLPMKADILRHWLDPSIPTSATIEKILHQPQLRVDMKVQRVKSYKHAEPLGELEILVKDNGV